MLQNKFFFGVLFLGFAVFTNGQTLPDDMSVIITKTGSQKAKIVVNQADKQWTSEQGVWSPLPEAAHPYVKSLFRKNINLNVELDCTDSPDSAAWAEKAAETAKFWFPKLVVMLDADNFEPVESVRIVFKKMDGVAYASGNTITVSENWIKKNPGDLGMIVHELIHIVQAYKSRVPGWVTEGIADYIRFFQYEPGKVGVRVDPKVHKHTDSYRITACFFDWIVRNKDEHFITKLNDICRKGNYNRETFTELTGKNAEQLWEEFGTIPSKIDTDKPD